MIAGRTLKSRKKLVGTSQKSNLNMISCVNVDVFKHVFQTRCKFAKHSVCNITYYPFFYFLIRVMLIKTMFQKKKKYSR